MSISGVNKYDSKHTGSQKNLHEKSGQTHGRTRTDGKDTKREIHENYTLK